MEELHDLGCGSTLLYVPLWLTRAYKADKDQQFDKVLDRKCLGYGLGVFLEMWWEIKVGLRVKEETEVTRVGMNWSVIESFW